MDHMGLRENDQIGIFVEEEKIIIERIHKIPNLQERLESFYQKPIDQIGHIDSEEANTGVPKGNEIS